MPWRIPFSTLISTVSVMAKIKSSSFDAMPWTGRKVSNVKGLETRDGVSGRIRCSLHEKALVRVPSARLRSLPLCIS